MAHPDFTDRSFAQLARRAIMRCSYNISHSMASAYIARARLKDAQAKLGAHSEQGRRYDRRIAIGRRARAAIAIVAANMAEVA